MDLEPLCTLSPLLITRGVPLDWVIQKVKGIQECVGIYCDGFKEQFRALLIAIEEGRFQSPRSTSRKNKELKCLTCSINYDGSEGSASNGRSMGKAIHEA